jgi:hypothetical protein
MWSVTSTRAERISGPEKFRSLARKDFFNSICHSRTDAIGVAWSTLSRPANNNVRHRLAGDRIQSVPTASAAMNQNIRFFGTPDGERRRPAAGDGGDLAHASADPRFL